MNFLLTIRKIYTNKIEILCTNQHTEYSLYNTHYMVKALYCIKEYQGYKAAKRDNFVR